MEKAGIESSRPFCVPIYWYRCRYHCLKKVSLIIPNRPLHTSPLEESSQITYLTAPYDGTIVWKQS